MKQIIQSFKTGDTILEEVPAPQVRKGTVLIQTSLSLVSLGTEKMLVEFGKANWVSKARQQPDKVRQVLEKIKTDGLFPTLEAVFNKLGEPLPLGYCNVGRIIATGEGVDEFKAGDRVVSNGHHAEFVCVPKNLVAHIPDQVTDEQASFTVIASIGLQGIRLLNPTLGETIVVIGMGLIGLLTAQLLKANGCNVIGMDIDDDKLALCKKWGILTCNPGTADSVKFVEAMTGNAGADGVIITASSKANEIISQAARMSRKRGRIILVGVIGLNISRADFYAKELTFQVSCSYGPGRYDHEYEQRGHDYPLPYVRWTEKRNFESVLQSIAAGKVVVNEMITEIVDISDYQKIYGDIGTKKSIAFILKYNSLENIIPANTVILKNTHYPGSNAVIGIIGAGNFAKMTLLPSLKGSSAGLKYIASAGGVTGTALAKKYGFSHSTTDYKVILQDAEVNLILIATRHNQHAVMVTEALTSGKHVFVEKPLALNNEELEQIITAGIHSVGSLMVGFNRRFSPHALKIKSLIPGGLMNVVVTVNAGHIPGDNWVQDMEAGGGRLIGEACHFVDLITFFTGSKVTAVCVNALGIHPEASTDNVSVLLKYENGSSGVINYFSNGSKAYPKERIEVYSQGKIAVIDNFRQTTGYGLKGFSKLRTRLDKGHKNQFARLIQSVNSGGAPLIPFAELINTSKATFAAVESVRQNGWIKIN